jgi:hypothetical protein
MTSKLPLIVAFTLLTGGCSFVFSSGPPEDHQQMPYFDCTSTMGLPVADGFFTTGNIVTAITTFRQSKEEFKLKNDGQNRNATGGIAVAGALISGASAIYGIVQANRCSAAKEELKKRILTPMLTPPVRPTPPPLPPPPPLPAPLPAPAPVEPAAPPATTPPPS